MAEGVFAVQDPGVVQGHFYPAQSQQMRVLRTGPAGVVLDTFLQGAEAAVLRVAEHFDPVLNS